MDFTKYHFSTYVRAFFPCAKMSKTTQKVDWSTHSEIDAYPYKRILKI